ncbi:MAG: hypothetical protein KBC30_01270 [Planctomycetes bacterium]|nr:hypothetical protein [Planctomycetota bacterium]
MKIALESCSGKANLLWGSCSGVLGRFSGVGKLNCPRVNWGYEVILFCLLF